MSENPQSTLLDRCRAGAVQAARWAEARAGVGATLLFAAIFLSPQFVDGYVGDDILAANTPGYLQLQGLNLGQYVSEEFERATCAGRFCPLAPALTYAVHAHARTSAAVHTVVFALVLMDVALFYLLLRLWGLQTAAASLGALFLAILFQLRYCPDPILQNAGLTPAVVGLILAAMVAFEHHLASGRLGSQAASLGMFATALLTDEIAFLVAPVFFVMAWRHRNGWRTSLAMSSAHATLVLSFAAFLVGVRYRYGWSTISVHYSPFDLAAICQAAALQASAAIPASYALLSPHRIDNMWERRLIGAWQNWAIFAAAGSLTWLYLRQLTRPEEQTGGPPAISAPRPSLRVLVVVGGVLWIMPGLLLALSPAQQKSLYLGLGHAPVFLQYFGVAGLALGFVLWGRAKWPRLWPKLVWGIVAFNASVAMLTFDTNTTVAAKINADPTSKSMALIESACEIGLFDSIPTGATVWSARTHAWMGGGPDRAGGHLSKMLGRLMHAVIGDPTPDWLVRRTVPDPVPAPSFVMNDLWPDLGWSYVVLGEVDAAATAALEGESSAGGVCADAYPVQSFRVFLTGSYVDRCRQSNELAIAVVRRDETGQPSWRLAQWIDLAELKVAKRNSSGVILEGTFAHAADMRLACVIEAKDVAGRLKAAQTLAAAY